MGKKVIIIFIISWIMAANSFAEQKVGLVLSGGGALGFAHIGAIQALEEAGYRPTVVSGTSMGALVGVLYAHGYKPDEIMQIVKDERLYRNSTLLRIRRSKNPGIYNLEAIRDLLKELMPDNSFDSLPKVFCACTTNLTEAVPEYICSGNQLAEYVIASASIPSFFEAQTINGVQYIDGGMLNNFPAQPIRDKCDFLIGVDVLPLTHKTAERTYEAMLFGLRDVQHVNSLPGHALCDMLIEVHAIDTYGEFDFKEYESIYQMGYEAAKRRIAELSGGKH